MNKNLFFIHNFLRLFFTGRNSGIHQKEMLDKDSRIELLFRLNSKNFMRQSYPVKSIFNFLTEDFESVGHFSFFDWVLSFSGVYLAFDIQHQYIPRWSNDTNDLDRNIYLSNMYRRNKSSILLSKWSGSMCKRI